MIPVTLSTTLLVNEKGVVALGQPPFFARSEKLWLPILIAARSYHNFWVPSGLIMGLTIMGVAAPSIVISMVSHEPAGTEVQVRKGADQQTDADRMMMSVASSVFIIFLLLQW